MRISARNQIKGNVVEVRKGATTSRVRVDIGKGTIVTSSITNEAFDELGIKAGDKVTIVVKASDVMIASTEMRAPCIVALALLAAAPAFAADEPSGSDKFKWCCGRMHGR